MAWNCFDVKVSPENNSIASERIQGVLQINTGGIGILPYKTFVKQVSILPFRYYKIDGMFINIGKMKDRQTKNICVAVLDCYTGCSGLARRIMRPGFSNLMC